METREPSRTAIFLASLAISGSLFLGLSLIVSKFATPFEVTYGAMLVRGEGDQATAVAKAKTPRNTEVAAAPVTQDRS